MVSGEEEIVSEKYAVAEMSIVMFYSDISYLCLVLLKIYCNLVSNIQVKYNDGHMY